MKSLIGAPLALPPPGFDPQLIEELLLGHFAALEKRVRSVLDLEVPRPWPLHRMYIEHSGDGRETLVMHDGRRIVLVAGVLYFHYATGAALIGKRP